MRYSISYDLRSPGRDYQTLWDELGRLGAKRMLQSHYVVRLTGTTAANMRDHIAKVTTHPYYQWHARQSDLRPPAGCRFGCQIA